VHIAIWKGIKLKLTKASRSYYGDNVWEFNLPAGYTCPFAKDCLLKADRQTGKQTKGVDMVYRCYAACSERYPAVRNVRWKNFDDLRKLKTKDGITSALSSMFSGKEKAIRIHGGGDFYNQQYFDSWLDVCSRMPRVEFWAFTKSIPYWVKRMHAIPNNLVLIASYGGTHDGLIAEHGFKYCIVYPTTTMALASGLHIDTDDTLARKPSCNFALVDNYEKKPKV